MGRLNQADWKADGFVAAFPEDWHYSLQYVPSRVPEGDLKVSEAVSRAMVESSFICGSPTEVAASLQGYVEAGATVICPLDYLMLAAPPDDPFRSLQMTMEVCSHVAARNR
jgi:alkanesulfonate monooxygenase SsuD/methylene tetrahydromethanopterin reductase-like flavin-dependent oxidoreductase (luciferase family)